MPPLLWAEFSIQFLIPAIFLVIWALNQVFGRSDAPQQAPRDRVGPRPIPPGPSRAPQQSNRSQPGPGGGRPSPSSSTRTAPSRSSQRPASRSGGPSRGRARPESEPQPSESAQPTRRPLPPPASVEDVYAIYDDERVFPKTVDRPPPTPVSAAELRPKLISDAPEPAPVVSTGFERMVRDGIPPDRLREAILLNEVLSPPIAVRRGGGRITGLSIPTARPERVEE